MDKLKSVFRPGGKQDDEILYGSGSSSKKEQTAKLETDPGVKDHGISRQIL
jgi:hypothetical protein